MKIMLLTDLVLTRRTLTQLVIMCACMVAFICIFTETVATIGASFTTMLPLFYLFTITAYDESNNWQTYRLSLPLSRKRLRSVATHAFCWSSWDPCCLAHSYRT
ncbi:MAG: ABC-2 transporter permease [Eggerthellaceae bacterium]